MFKLIKRIFNTPSPGAALETGAPVVSGDHSDEGRSLQAHGNALLAQGQFDKAATCYRRAIAITPHQIEGYINLGYALSELRQSTEAEAVIRQAMRIDPTCTDALYMLATIARNDERWIETIEHLERLRLLKPDFETVYAELCNALSHCGRDEEARSVILDGIALFPNIAQYHFILANLYARSQDHERAIARFNQAIMLQPDYANLYFHLAASLFEQHRLDEAVTALKKAIALKPDYLEAYAKLATALLHLSRYDEALIYYDLELRVEPNNLVALVNRSTTLHKLGRNEEALASCDRALKIQSDSSEAMMNRGVALTALNRQHEALACYNQANLIKPGDCDILTNRGNALQYLDRPDEALRSFTEALRINPDHIDANLNLALSRLQIGDYTLGWQQYEWRWRKEPLQKLKPHYEQPLWLGKEALNGKTILLVAEQGLGDTIQFCRYAKRASETGANVLLLVPRTLAKLLSTLDGVKRILVDGEALPPFDYYCPLMSLPLAFNTSLDSVPCDIPYLKASIDLTQRIGSALGNEANFRIGLCWKGSTSYAADSERSPGIAPFGKFMSRFFGTTVKFHTLLPDSRDLFTSIGGEDLGHEIDHDTAPFEETAALIMNLDLVITADTSIGHIAAALGRPVWLVVPFSPDWRWIRGRDDSPWYPNSQLFRQASPGDWEELFDRVAARLTAVLDGTSELNWPFTPDKPVDIDAASESGA